MTDQHVRALQRAMKPGDVDAARRYLRAIMRNGDPLETLAELLAGQLLELRSRLLLHAVQSFAFGGGDESKDFRITVSKRFVVDGGEAWVLFRHAGLQPVVDDWAAASDCPTMILCENPYTWARYLGSEAPDPDDQLSVVAHVDIYEAATLAINIADGRINPITKVRIVE